MKKIVLILVAALFAVVAEAGAVKWTTLNVFAPDGTKSSNIGYLFAETGDVSKSAVAAILAGSDSAAAASYFAANSINNVTPTTAGTFTSAATDYTAGTYSFFAVIFDGANVADSSNYFITSVVSKAVPASGTATVSFGNLSAATSAAGAYTSAGWATPEPTSGMLLLLGGALLALRRKRK